ncbi:MAG: glutamate--tRNA ligase [Alphaproteobacteria bacterium]|nr:glutamate--tRNA ligase [Alphaproteobacteria bacterium]
MSTTTPPPETVRFAPSPTGRLHVGNIRTALQNWLFVRRREGRFILRIDDTDRERSTREHERAILADLAWLGLTHDGFARQSERLDLYEEAAGRLKASGHLYPCYETADELERKRRLRLARGLPPVYDRSALELTAQDRARLEAEGRVPHWRFRLSQGPVSWTDLVRGPTSIDTASTSDPILIREDGSFLYTLPSVVDDIELGITTILRGEDHVTNSGAQIEIFEALGAPSPKLGHAPLLVGADGEKLSKRLGALSIEQLRGEGIEPLAIACLLAKLGTSDAVEPAPSLEALAEAFDLEKLGRAPARFDPAELAMLNARLVHDMPYEAVAERLHGLGIGDGEAFWEAIRENIGKVEEAREWWAVVAGPVTPVIPDPGFAARAAELLPEGELTPASWKPWVDAIKAATGAKGRALFMPLRQALTGREHGPEMEKLIALIGRKRVLARLAGKAA